MCTYTITLLSFIQTKLRVLMKLTWVWCPRSARPGRRPWGGARISWKVLHMGASPKNGNAPSYRHLMIIMRYHHRRRSWGRKWIMLAQFSEAGFWWWTGKRFVPKLVKKSHDFFFVTTVCIYVYDFMAIYILCLHEMNNFFLDPIRLLRRDGWERNERGQIMCVS